MAGPNREWHVGDHGPGPTAWSEKGPKPMASGLPPLAEHIARGVERRMGRDPHDHVTMELPGMELPVPDCMVTRIAAGLYEIADDEVPWLLLFLREESEWEAAEMGDFRKAGKLARVLESLP